MEPEKSKSQAASKPSLSQQILRSFRTRPAVGPVGASLGPSQALPPITTTTLPTPKNPFEHASPTLMPVSPYILPTTGAHESQPYSTHNAELRRPLPSSSSARAEAVKDRILRLRMVCHALQKSAENPGTYRDEVPLAEVFKLCAFLLTSEHPQNLRIEACNLLTVAVKLADTRAATASRALTETRSGAPGSLSSKASDSDQPLASIDRALFYRLVLAVSATEAGEDGGDESTRSLIEALPAQLRALEVLSREGREVVGFPDIVVTLSEWLAIAWHEVQMLRKQVREFQVDRLKAREAGSNPANLDQQKSEEDLVSRLSANEWNLQAGLHLLTCILKFSFSRIPLVHIETALCKVATLMLGAAPAALSDEQVVLSSQQSQAEGVSSRVTPSLGAQKPRPRGGSSSRHRSKSKDARPLLDGYSYYGLETISPSESEETSPAETPRMTPKLGSRSGPSELSTGAAGAAPIALATVPPHRTRAGEDMERGEIRLFVGPELHREDVRCVLKLLDAALRYGYLPPACIDPVMQMVCRFLGHSLKDASSIGLIPPTNLPKEEPWKEDVCPFIANVLRSHCANAAIRSVRDLLVLPDGDTLPLRPEDPAVLSGAVVFIRITLAFIAEYEAEKQSNHPAPSSKPQVEDALAPYLSLSLILPALRGALKRHCDLLDLEVLYLVADLLPSRPSEGEQFKIPLMKSKLGHSDWDSLLDLTVEARRHVEGWKLKGRAINPFTGGVSPRRGSEVHQSALPLPVEGPVLAMVGVLSRLRIAPPPRSASSIEPDQDIPKAGADFSDEALPWTPKLAALLLSLAPILPDSTIVDLVEYYRSQHLCLPSNPEWIFNIRGLLQAFFHRNEHVGDECGASPAPQARRQLASLVFEHVYEAVQDVPIHRCELLTKVILPLCKSSLGSESDRIIEEAMRNVLVQAAVLCGSQPKEKFAQNSVAHNGDKGSGDSSDEVFAEIRRLMCRLARSAEPSLPSTSLLTMSGKTPIMEAQAFSTHSRQNSQQLDGSSSLLVDGLKATKATVDLIAIFNHMAFTSPWSFSFGSTLDAKGRAAWEKKARDGCIAIFRDLLELLRPRPKPVIPDTPDKGMASRRVDEASRPEVSTAEKMPLALEGTATVRARLVALEFLLRLRTDKAHRVYITADVDYLISASATLLQRGPIPAQEGSQAAAKGESGSASMERNSTGMSSIERSRAVRPTGVLKAEREGRDNQRNQEAANRSKSRARELSRDRGERGRADRANDSPRRGDRNRSVSQRRRSAGDGEPLWRLPQKLSFELPTSTLRSDIIYTYIHQQAEPGCNHGHTHTFDENGEPPAPLPVSEFLSTAIDIMTIEQDWELVSYLICHLPHQLANKHLFCGPKAQIQVLNLLRVLCEGVLQQTLFPHVLLPEDVKRTDIYAVSYGMLTVLISYRTLFSRSQQDEMVEAFIAGLNKSQNTAQPCVRALHVAVYELQKSVTRLLSGMLVKLSTVMSSMTMSVHILELIAAIAHIPACHANFTEADYRRVFGIALQYIQYHQSTAAATRDDWKASPSSFSLSQYVMMMAYYNISLWFMTLRISERPKYVPHITRGLLLANEGLEQQSDQTEVCFDFLARFTYSNAEAKPKRSFLNSVIMGPNGVGGRPSKDGSRQSKTWLIGKSLLTVTSMKREGWIEVLIRRPSGTTSMLAKIENSPISTAPIDGDDHLELPAMLMMQRDPSLMNAPILRAVRLPGQPTQGSSVDRSLSVDRWSLREEAQNRIKVGDILRARRPLGPAQFGLGTRPRSSSFSSETEGAPMIRSISSSGAYRQPIESRHDEVDFEKKAAEERVNTMDLMKQALLEPTPGHLEKVPSIEGGGKIAASRYATAKDMSIDPSHIPLQLSAYPDQSVGPSALLLPDEPSTDRLIRAIDLTPVVDFHKIGVLYVGPGQVKEVDILGNRQGSPAYNQFLSGLGDLVTLKNQEDIYTGGLDRENDIHGRYAYAWKDAISQIIYHTATLMPNRPHDPIHASKKALIGNDWVHIVFNESGQEYRFGTIPSQFNFVNICVSPNTRGGANLGSATPDDATFCLPSFSPVGDGQLISVSALPAFVRTLCLKANLISQIYLDTGEAMQPYTSNWVSRLHHIQRYRSQLEAKLNNSNRDSDSQDFDLIEVFDFTRRF
ncbi:hypothetical protein IE53DRAFT_366166 [Violaceomyces palustris]|uniref:Uncharacterized protein n=1 Tax=Violaceomyces palustris TaxID=1673888 RepID=A0ACD0P6Q2_9BASI|nr:hypothetical protein IE53DRAFT_366166 [Violaceomyces palustris]